MKKALWPSRLAGGLALLLLLTATGCRSDAPPSPSTPESTASTATAASTGEKATVSTKTNGVTTKATTVQTVKTTVATTTSTAKPTTTATKPQTPAVKGTVKVSDYIPDAQAWTFDSFPGRDDFTLQTQILGYEPFVKRLQELSIVHHQVGDTGYPFTHYVENYEWSSNTVLQMLEGQRPATRQAAMNIVFGWLEQQTAGKSHPWAAMESYMRYQHYTAAFGYDYIGCEIGVNVSSGNLSIAFTRGASKQYNKRIGAGNVAAWFVDYSLWNDHGMVNYSGNPKMYNADGRVSSNATSGQSVESTRRAYYMAYMAGTNWLISESGGEAAFYSVLNGEETAYALSPHGEVFQEFYAFTKRNPDRGVAYTPYGIVINYDHGFPYGHWKPVEVFDVFAPTAADQMVYDLMAMFWPNAYPTRANNEVGQQVATPYGETADILTQNAAQRVLNSYPVLILAGPIHFTADEVSRYMEYVARGGILVMNAAYKTYFPEFSTSKPFGKGRVIVYGDAYDVSELYPILDELTAERIPFTVDGYVQYMVNVKEGSLVLTVINNEGIYKRPATPVQLDDNWTQEVTVTYTGSGKVLEVRDWMTGEARKTDSTQTFTLKPGGVAVLEFVV